MCHSVVRILFKPNDRQLVSCDTAEDLAVKIESLQSNEQVIEFTVFSRHVKFVKKTTWEELP